METLLFLLIAACAAYGIAAALGVDVWAMLAAWPTYAWVVLVMIPLAYAGYSAARRLITGMRFSPGDHVVYLKQKFSTHPGRRAEQVHPAAHGDGYSYLVRKPWTVTRIVDEEAIEVVTPGGKRHVVHTDDPHLRRPGLIETLALRLRWRKRFPESA